MLFKTIFCSIAFSQSFIEFAHKNMQIFFQVTLVSTRMLYHIVELALNKGLIFLIILSFKIQYINVDYQSYESIL